jgi:osomolarity two-component system, response regulator SKN7
MNDVLPKPYTKEGMLRTLEKHLSQFKKNYAPQQAQIQDQFATPNTPLGLNMGHMSARGASALAAPIPACKLDLPSVTDCN